jgi:pyrroline-5-carboxylate reductase
MQGAIVRIGKGDMSNAIAEGMVKAENIALKETVDMLLHEIAEKDEIIAMYRWKEQRDREQTIERYKRKKIRVPVWQRIASVLGFIG